MKRSGAEKTKDSRGSQLAGTTTSGRTREDKRAVSGKSVSRRQGKSASLESQELTPLLAIKGQRRRAAQIEEIVVFLEKLVVLAVVLAVLLGVVFGLVPMADNDMSPRISAGDLLLYYRLDKNPVSGDVIVCRKNGELYVGRVVARGGETVEVTEEATLKINDSTVMETDIYYSTPQYDSDVVYPVTLAEDEVFVLCDYREGAEDSRMFGAVNTSEILGTVILVIRRSDL